MKWNETIASECRYGDIAGTIWKDWEIVWEDSENDYQGHASFIATKDGKWSLYEWWYGSCSGCDGWEADGKNEEEIAADMRKDAMWFGNFTELFEWFGKLTGNFRSNASPDRGGGGIVFGLDFLAGGIADRLKEIKEAATKVACMQLSNEERHKEICQKCPRYSGKTVPLIAGLPKFPDWCPYYLEHLLESQNAE